MRIIVLGAAAGGGFPQWNVANPLNQRARAKDPLAPARTQSSIAVSVDDDHWLVCNASPDIRQQLTETPALHPRPDRGLRDTPIHAVLVTNGDIDHVAGLLTLRERQAFTLYGTDRVLSVLAANSVFNVLNPDFVSREEIALNKDFEACPGLSVSIFPVPGKVALYMEDENAANLGTAEGDTVGVALTETATGKTAFYIPGCAAMTDDLADRLRGQGLVMFDGTLFTDDEMIASGEGVKTGQRMGHMSMTGEGSSIDAFADLNVARKIFVHINNTNPALVDGTAERKTVEDAGWQVAYDGMEITL